MVDDTTLWSRKSKRIRSWEKSFWFVCNNNSNNSVTQTNKKQNPKTEHETVIGVVGCLLRP